MNEERLSITVSRLQEAATSADSEALARLIGQLKTRDTGYLKWLRSQQGGATCLVPVDSVVYFQADGKYTSVMTASEEHLIRTSIRELTEALDPDRFWQVHRSLIVRVDEILEAHRNLRGRYTLSLRSRPEQLRTSQKYGHLFKGM